MPVPERHYVLDAPLHGPFPADTERAMFGLGCFWGAERKFWQTPGVYTTAVGYAGGLTPNPTYEEVCSARTGHNEVVLVVYARRGHLRGAARGVLGGHDPTQGMRQGNDVGTQYRSGIYTTSRRAGGGRRGLARALPGGAEAAGRGAITTEIVPAPGLLLRRGLPPAVPRQEPARLLRPRRHRRHAARSARAPPASSLTPGAPGVLLTSAQEDVMRRRAGRLGTVHRHGPGDRHEQPAPACM